MFDPSNSTSHGRQPTPRTTDLRARIHSGVKRIVSAITPSPSSDLEAYALISKPPVCFQFFQAVHDVFQVRLTRADLWATSKDLNGITLAIERLLDNAASRKSEHTDRAMDLGAETLPSSSPSSGTARSHETSRRNRPKELKIGARVGPYTVCELIGTGSFCHVYKAEDKEGNLFALKFGKGLGGSNTLFKSPAPHDKTNPNIVSDDVEFADVFRRKERDLFVRRTILGEEIDQLLRVEANSISSVNSTLAVKVHDCIEWQDRPILVLPYIEGRTLREIIRSRDGIHLNWFGAIASDLSTAGYSHLDLKPENIIIDGQGKVHLIDRGFAIRGSGDLLTTAEYNPFLSRTGQADVIAIGIMIYEIATGRRPWQNAPLPSAGKNPVSDNDKVQRSFDLTHEGIDVRNSKFPVNLAGIVHSCLTCSEYTAKDLSADLRRFIDNHSE